ncbi:MAG: hypothetical protein R3D89_10150 [Sphingomonadaceae bacterium]
MASLLLTYRVRAGEKIDAVATFAPITTGMALVIAWPVAALLGVYGVVASLIITQLLLWCCCCQPTSR